MDPSTERDLIERAMEGVVIVFCEPCNGIGELLSPRRPAKCPACGGSGVTTMNELEMDREHR